MPQSISKKIQRPKRFVQNLIRALIASSFVLLLSASPAFCQGKASASGAAEPVVTVNFPSVDQAYGDLKFIFDLVNDQKGYTTLKDTLDVFLVGVETDKAGGLRFYSTPDGLRGVITLPVKSE